MSDVTQKLVSPSLVEKKFPMGWGQTGAITAFVGLIFLLASGVSWGYEYFPMSGSYFIRMQADSLLQGHLALSSNIQDMAFDLAWYQGVQQLWGLGVALWYLPFIALGRLLGFPCPDIIPLMVALLLLTLYTLRTMAMLIRQGDSLLKAMLFAFLVLFCPALLNFLSGAKLVYEVTCLYALIASITLLVATIRFVLERRQPDFFLACFLAGFVAVIRPTHGIYGAAAGCICLWLALEPWRREHSVRHLWQPVAGAVVILSGFLFLAGTNILRFGNSFEFGHNLSFSTANIVYPTRFGNPCEEASIVALGRELFYWLFIPWSIPSGEAPIPRWRDIYQTTFDPSYLLIGIVVIIFLGKRLRIKSNEEQSLQLRSHKGTLPWGLFFWFAFTAGALCFFFLRFATLSTRYILDLAPAFLPLTLIPLFCSPQRYAQKTLYFLYLWAVLQILWTQVIYPLWQPGDAFRRQWQKTAISYGGGQLRGLQNIDDFNGTYSQEAFPGLTGITGNGMGWNKEKGTVGSIGILMVDRPQFLELILGPEEEGFPEVYRAKINNIELSIESITSTTVGTNAAKCVRFSIPGSILRQDCDQMVSLCFTPSFNRQDMQRTRPLYKVRWR